MWTAPEFHLQYSTEGQLEAIKLMARQWEHIADIRVDAPRRQTMRQAAGNERTWQNWVDNDPKIDPDMIVTYPGIVWFYRKPGKGDEFWHNCHVYMRAIGDIVNSLFMMGKF